MWRRCFPGLATSLASSSWHLGSWFPIVLVAAFNTGDLLGKAAPSRARLFGSRGLPCAVLCHALFVPTLLALAHPTVLPADGTPFGWLRSDGFAVLVVGGLGVCTGYIGCMGLMLGAEHGATSEEKELVGMITSFSLMLGLAVGSLTGLLLARAVS